jgi:hypothetical protein
MRRDSSGVGELVPSGCVRVALSLRGFTIINARCSKLSNYCEYLYCFDISKHIKSNADINEIYSALSSKLGIIKKIESPITLMCGIKLKNAIISISKDKISMIGRIKSGDTSP